ncbi:MAG: cysteine desulfurase [Rikenellaceae bacterium]|nr:cysteine desulfurase [Rikenellaceae bacterium]
MFDIQKIRNDFPILESRVYGRPLIYLDSGATAQKPACVIEKTGELYRTLNGNIHRGAHYLAEQMTEQYEAAREEVRRFIGAKDRSEVIFTAGATASLNTVAYSYCEAFLKAGDNLIVSEMEHHSNIVPWQLMCERKGAELRVLRFDDTGRLMSEQLPELLDERTRVVAITQASNTLGTRPELKPMIEKAHAAGAVVVIDGCQGVVHGGVNVEELDCDFYAFSGHKLYGPTGIGILYGKRELLEKMPPFLCGGDMVDRVSFERTTYAELPLKFEAGTANFIGAVGLAEAIRYLSRLDLKAVEAHESDLLHYATERLNAIEGLRIYGNDPSKCAILSFTIEGTHPYDVGMILDKLGVAIRTGQHCAEPVMKHFGVKGMCRASIGLYNTHEEIDQLEAALKRAVRMLR